MNKSTQEGVVLIFTDESKSPSIMVRQNGSVKYYKLVEMSFADHVEFLGADVVNKDCYAIKGGSQNNTGGIQGVRTNSTATD